MLLQLYLYGNLCIAIKCTENQSLCLVMLLQIVNRYPGDGISVDIIVLIQRLYLL